MKMMTIFGLIVFAAAAAGGWYVKTNVLVEAKEETVDATNIDLNADPLAQPTEILANGPSMPVPIRDEAMTVEELLRFSLSLKERAKGLNKNEEQLRQRKVQQQLVMADVQAEQQTVNGLRTQLATKLQSAGTMMEEMNQIRESIIAEREKTKQEFGEIESRRIDITEQHKANDKKLSTWLQGMTGEKSAAVLKEMANDGNMKVAVQLLSNFEEREAAKILDSIDDPKLLNEFISEFRNLKNARSSAKGKSGAVR